MVTGQRSPSGEIRILGDEHAVGRLGKGVDANGCIQPETFDRIASILNRYHRIATSFGAEEIVGYGTSALRDAENREEFIEAMKERTGILLRLLDGPDEALWTWQGALFGLPVAAPNIVVLDIGGGSTEIAYGSDKDFCEGVSVDTGAVRVTERFFRNTLPPNPADVHAAQRFTRECFQHSISLPANKAVVGVAGTLTTLAAIATEVSTFSADEINSTVLSREWVHATTKKLLSMTLEEIEGIPQVVKGREDILPGGALVLAEFMNVFDVPEIIVSTRGLRYGLLMKEMGER